MTGPGPADPIQWSAPVSNDVEWYFIALTISCGAALLCYGIHENVRRWEAELHEPEWFSVIGEIAGIALAMAFSALVGYLVWHWGLGLVSGTVGAWASPWFVHKINAWWRKKYGDDKP